jgi:hypothetical protein
MQSDVFHVISSDVFRATFCLANGAVCAVFKIKNCSWRAAVILLHYYYSILAMWCEMTLPEASEFDWFMSPGRARASIFRVHESYSTIYILAIL